MAFVQLIELTTSRIEEAESLLAEFRAATEGKRTARRSTLAADRDRPNTYVTIVEFDSYESAMENSRLPETGEFAQKLGALCDSPPTFRNLDVRRVEELASQVFVVPRYRGEPVEVVANDVLDVDVELTPTVVQQHRRVVEVVGQLRQCLHHSVFTPPR